MHTATSNILYAILVAILVHAAAFAFYRLYFHKLSCVPGPRLAAITGWYETYFEVFKDGGLVEHLYGLHRLYGPVVRIGPNIVHFSRVDDYHQIYTNGVRFRKDPRMYTVTHEEESSFGLVDLREAKVRRDVLSPMFSRKAVLRLESVIQRKINKLIERMLSSGPNAAVDMQRGARSVALEVIIAYCFAQDYGVLDTPGFAHPVLRSFETSFPSMITVKHFPWIYPLIILRSLIIAYFNPSEQIHDFVGGVIFDQIDALLAHPELLDSQEHETIYHHLMSPHPEKGQPDIPSRNSLAQEAINLLAAGSFTVGDAGHVGLFYVLNDRDIYQKIKDELRKAWPNKDERMPLEALEKLPYLTAIIKESLRISPGPVLPLPRIVGPNDTEIGGYSIPAGTSVGMGVTFIHFNPDIFDDPYQFQPQRWLDPELEHFLVPFSKGPRSCLGLNLAWAELYMFFGNLFRRVDMQLNDTTLEDMKFRCHFTATYRGKHLSVLASEATL